MGAAALCVANLLDALATVLACRRCAERSGGAGAPLILRETAFLRHLYIETIILPRQARDKHGENSKKMPFSPPAMYTRSGRRSYSHHHLSLHLPPREAAAAAAAAAAHCRGRWLPMIGSCSQSTAPCTPAKKRLVAQLFLCLSRACLGKMIVLKHEMGPKRRFPHRHPVIARSLCWSGYVVRARVARIIRCV
eukprot:COSAG06_NODE_24258_length_668_cov_0.910369_1_plen_192_part_10